MGSHFTGYKAWVLRDREYMREGEDLMPEAPPWAIKATENVTSLALRLWDKAYQDLANDFCEPHLARVVLIATNWGAMPDAVGGPTSKDNPIWDLPWTQLSAEQRAAAERLGWSAQLWANSEWVMPRSVAWSDLSAEARCSFE